MRRVRATIVGVEQQRVLHILSVCVYKLTYRAYNAQCAIMSSVKCPALYCLSTLSHEGYGRFLYKFVQNNSYSKTK